MVEWPIIGPFPQAPGRGFGLLLAVLFLFPLSSARGGPSRLFALAVGVAGREHRGDGQASTESLAKQIEDSLAKGDFHAAQRLVPEFLAQPRVSDETLLRIGSALAEHDLDPQAANVFERSVHDFPQRFEGYYDLSYAYLALRRYSEALAMLADAPGASPRQEIARTYLRGKIEAAVGRDAEAERDLAAAFAAAPGEENYGLDLGLYYLRAQKYHQALAIFKQAVKLEGDSPFLQLGLGLAQFLGGLNSESVETCRAALALHPDFSPARLMLAFALYMQGNMEAAERTAAQGLLDPNPFPYLYYIHAVSLIKLQSRDYDLMLKDLTAAARAIPQCSLCYVALGKVHQRKGEQKIALADLEKAVDLDPTFAEAWYRLAGLYEQAGRPEAARQARQRFEKLKGNKTDRETEILRGVFSKSLEREGVQ